jgi:hypothetical protein
MGEYWKPVNLTRREFVHPHHVECGLKLPEWNHANSGVRRIIDKRWGLDDDVRALSDYGGELQMWGEPTNECPAYEDIEDVLTEVRRADD